MTTIDIGTGDLTLDQLIERLRVLGVDDHGKIAAAYWLGVLRDRVRASRLLQNAAEELLGSDILLVKNAHPRDLGRKGILGKRILAFLEETR